MTEKIETATQGGLPDSFEDLCVQLGFPRVIEDDTAYENALEIVERLVARAERSPGQQAYLDTFATLIERYERERYPLPEGDPLEVLKFLLSANGMTAADLSKLLGDATRSLGSRILRGERQLSKAHIATLCRRFGVSADLFLGLT
ncbi:MAG: transcriptional regulator [Planctomycetota bacterium]|nr:MAG: transcriptional regulator [Planctomycetota bacterium]